MSYDWAPMFRSGEMNREIERGNWTRAKEIAQHLLNKYTKKKLGKALVDKCNEVLAHKEAPEP